MYVLDALLALALIGALFAWLYLRSVRSMRRTPRPVLRVSRDALPIGASFDVHWTMAGPVS